MYKARPPDLTMDDFLVSVAPTREVERGEVFPRKLFLTASMYSGSPIPQPTFIMLSKAKYAVHVRNITIVVPHCFYLSSFWILEPDGSGQEKSKRIFPGWYLIFQSP